MTFDEMMAGREPGSAVLDAADAVNSAFLWANRALDTDKEALWIRFGMPFTSGWIHRIAHANLERLDRFGDYLHEEHLTQTYPATPALTEPLESVGKTFEVAATIIDEVDAALNRFIAACSGGRMNALALATETLQMENSADRTRVLQVWKMWDSGGMSQTSFDSWVRRLTENDGGEAGGDD